MSQEQRACETAFEFELGESERRSESLQNYWVYPISTRTSLDQYPNKIFSCKRRFNDFFLLRQALVDAHPGVIVPPVPEKSSQTVLERTGLPVETKHVVDYRSRALRKFLVRVGAHPVLSVSPLLQDFLTLPEELYARKRSEHEAAAKAEKKASGTGGTKQKLREMKYSLQHGDGNGEPADPSTAPEDRQGPTADEWAETARYVQSLEDYLNALRDRIAHLINRRKEHCDSMKTFGRSLAKLGDFETDSRRGTGGAERNGARVHQLGLSEAGPRCLVQVGNRAEHVSLVYAEVAMSERVQVVETIRYYLGMCAAIRQVLDNIKRMTLSRDTYRHEKAAAESGEKTEGTEAKVADLAAKDAQLTRAVRDAEDVFREEFTRFHRERQFDMKQLIKAFVDIQCDAAERLKQSWDTVQLAA